jgi:hypothetical protein
MKQTTKRPTFKQRQEAQEMKTALTMFVVMMLLLLMLTSCAQPKGSALPCYYFADKGGAQQ